MFTKKPTSSHLETKKIFATGFDKQTFNYLKGLSFANVEVEEICITSKDISILLDKKPDILLLDSIASDISKKIQNIESRESYKILHQIWKDPKIQSLPILVIGSLYEARENILKLGGYNGWVPKPIDLPCLKSRIAELLEQTSYKSLEFPKPKMILRGSGDNMYQITSKISKGGMEHIYEAIRLHDQEKVAIKYFGFSSFKNPKTTIRFLQEAITTMDFECENLIHGYDFVISMDHCFYVSELTDGETLQQIIHKKGKFSPSEALEVILQVTNALEALDFDHHLIHRNIEPSNIIITSHQLVKLINCGASKIRTFNYYLMMRRRFILETPYYLSPEQVLGKDITIQSDIYSLGAIFYHMLTGKYPFEGEDDLDIIHQRLTKEPRDLRELNPEIPLAISNIVLKMMKKHPSKRYDNAEELKEELKEMYQYIKTNQLDLQSEKK